MAADNGGPAFPSHGSMGEVAHEGMTLRDYFAVKALQGMLADGENNPDGTETYESFAEDMADSAYIFADAMLTARSL